MGLFGKKKDKDKEPAKDKKRFNETGFGRFLVKAAGKLPDIIGDVATIIERPVTGSIEVLSDILNEKKAEADESGDKERVSVITQLQVDLEKNRQDFERDIFELEVRDRESARDMFKSDSWLQKTFALTFLVAYMLLTTYLIYIIVQTNDEHKEPLPDYVIALISTIFGALSTKLNTIVSFLFGSSMGSKQKNTLMSGNN